VLMCNRSILNNSFEHNQATLSEDGTARACQAHLAFRELSMGMARESQ